MTGSMTPRQLYKALFKQIKLLPPGVQDYYRHFVRQQFNSHSDENDKERIDAIIHQARKDAIWLLKKHKVDEAKIKEIESSLQDTEDGKS